MYPLTDRKLFRFHQHRDIAALIDLYESNFYRLSLLAPELDQLEGTCVSRVAGALSLYLTVLERHKYTTTINLSYTFDGDDELCLEPNARICVYHDVRSVELISHCRRRRYQRNGRWPKMPELQRKWEMNRFLLKWLKFCAYQGHLFLSSTAMSAPHIDSVVRSLPVNNREDAAS